MVVQHPPSPSSQILAIVLSFGVPTCFFVRFGARAGHTVGALRFHEGFDKYLGQFGNTRGTALSFK